MAKSHKPGSRHKLASVSRVTLRRANPAENVRMGWSPKARRYVRAGVKVTGATKSASARQAETKRIRERYGYATPEAAKIARRDRVLSYESQDQARRVAKAGTTRLLKRISGAAGRGEEIEYDPLGKRKGNKRRTTTLKPGDEQRYADLRARRLRGEWFDIVDFVWLMDMAQHFGDADSRGLRASPDARSPSGEDEGDFYEE